MSKVNYYILIGLALATGLVALMSLTLSDSRPQVCFLDIGQGDAILLQEGSTQVLIDGGPDAKVIEKLGEYMPFWDRKIELVILSHAHADHFVGLIDVLDRYQVEKFLWSGAEEDAADFQIFSEKLDQEQSSIYLASQKQVIEAGSFCIDILYPFSAWQFVDQSEENLNNTSIVARVKIGEHSYLLTGDAEKEVEADLLESNTFVAAKVLKAGHHGSKTSSSSDFVRAVNPDSVIFSAGRDNKFNHPASLVVENFKDLGVETLTTFETGDIVK